MTFVVLCSSKGTVFQSVIESMERGELSATCAGLIADKETRGCVKKARDANIPVVIVERQENEAREAYDQRLSEAIDKLLKSHALELKTQTSNLKPQHSLVACMGWMWMLSPWFVGRHRHRILNVHPALLPRHPGAHAHALVLQAKDTESGMTIHLIDEGMDTGAILLQKRCPVLEDDTEETLKARVQKLECEWYPKVLEMIERGEMKLDVVKTRNEVDGRREI